MTNNIKSKTINIKVVLLGEAGVGKTSIIQRFIENKYDPYTTPTLGASFFIKNYEINKKEITYQIWDTAGQERYRGLGRQFYKNSKIGILVYDITSTKSFKELENYWHKELIENSEEGISIL